MPTIEEIIDKLIGYLDLALDTGFFLPEEEKNIEQLKNELYIQITERKENK